MQVVNTEKWLQSIPQGFDYRPGSDTVTKGIWIWSKPFIIKSQDKEVCISDGACIWLQQAFIDSLSIECTINYSQ